MDLVVLVVALVCAVAMYLTWTATRLDRLSTRLDAAWTALDAQLVRRAGLAAELAAHARRRKLVTDDAGRRLERAALAAQQAGPGERETVENELTAAVRALVADLGPTPSTKSAALVEGLDQASTRVGHARQFHNDAVRDSRALRRRWVSRLLLVGRTRQTRGFFEIEDPTLAREVPAADPRQVS